MGENLEKSIDYFMIIGLHKKETNGTKTLKELQQMKPDIISSFPECNPYDKNKITDLISSM